MGLRRSFTLESTAMVMGRPAIKFWSTVHVRLEGRTFIVCYEYDGNVRRIKERKQKELPVAGVCDVVYWDAKCHVLGKKNTMPKRIIAAAVEKQGC
jgi:hypothetical protein